MKIVHISDRHGHLSELPKEIDTVVSSGDFFPNSRKLTDQRSSREEYVREEIKYQRNWIYHHKKQLNRWLDGRNFLYSLGNHDFHQFEEDFKAIGLNAICLDNKIIEHKNITYAGFPFVVYYQNNWMWEKTSEELYQEQQKLKQRVKDFGKPLEIAVMHCPPFKILDYYFDKETNIGENLGSQPLADWISYGEDKPKYILSGHVHSAHGFQEVNGVKVYNSATICQVIDI